MNAEMITDLFGRTVADAKVQDLFAALGTQNRPALPSDDKFVYHDWVLVRRKGVELGFADSQYQTAAPRAKWRHGKLMLTQAYFYAGLDEVRPYGGSLPFGLVFSDNRQSARQKLARFEATRHSYLSDTWDVDGYRLHVHYAGDTPVHIKRVVCRMLAQPLPVPHNVVWPPLDQLIAALGEAINAPVFTALWGPHLVARHVQEARKRGEIDFTETFGATLALTDGDDTFPLLRSITLHRNRDMEAVGWQGTLPLNLNFDDSPEVLFGKMPTQALEQVDGELTGYAVWAFADHTLHVLYSNLDNRILRIELFAPGVWQAMQMDE